jgi:hypothetical protein
MDSDDEFEEPLTKTTGSNPEPEAERSPRPEPAAQDEWSTVQRKGSKQKPKNQPVARRPEMQPEVQVPRKDLVVQADDWNTVRRKGKKPSKEEPPVVAQAYPARANPTAADTRREPPPQARAQAAEASRSRVPDRKRPEQRVEVGMEESPSFPVVKRLIGPSGANLKRIREACPRAVVSLRGRGCPGSGTERDQSGPLHFVISAPNEEIEKSVRMVEALVADVRGQRDRQAQKRC